MRIGWRRLGRACAVLVAACGLTACVAQPDGLGYRPIANAPSPALAAPSGHRIALLLPLTGANADLGHMMRNAAALALSAGGGDAPVDERDTGSTPSGAVSAARSAIANGAGIIVGPLTSSETRAVARVAEPLHIPVLAFTSDDTHPEPGVWALGITPWQQVRTLVRAASAQGHQRFGALMPSNPFGDALIAGLLAATQEVGAPPPVVARYIPGTPVDEAVAQIARAPGAPVDALLLGATVNDSIAMLPALQAAGLGPSRVELLGTALWTRDAQRAVGQLRGIFVGSAPGALRVFEQNYMARYGSAPRDVAAVAFDAAGAARAVTGPQGVDVSRLLSTGGFAGANGVFILLPDGHVRRDLGVFELTPEGVRPLSPPPPAAVPFG